MLNIRMLLLAMLLLLGACGEMGAVRSILQPANQQLADGIKSYDQGDYQSAFLSIRTAQETGLNDKHDQVIAHKYLAFIHCVSGREQQCRDEFREALEIDPSFDLSPAEAGHPIWGPVFRDEQAKLAK